MVLKAAFVRLQSGALPFAVVGFLFALIIGIPINYFFDGVLINLNTFSFGLLGAILACLHARRKEPPSRAAEASSAEGPHPPLNPPRDLLSHAQLRKLNLEIDDLRLRTHWEHRVARYVPPVTVGVAVISLVIGLYQFKTQQWIQHEQDLQERQKARVAQNLERRIRFQNQIRGDLDQILRFAPDEKQTISTALFLLLDLKTILESKVSENEKMKDIFPGYEENVTMNLVTSIKYDSDFSRSARDVRFATTVFDNWDDYRRYLKTDMDSLERVLYLHIRAIRRLRDDNPGYFEDMDYEKKTGWYFKSERFEKQANEEQRYQHFLAIKTGFMKHMELLDLNSNDSAKALKDTILRNFQSALCGNEGVSTSILKTYFAGQSCD